MACWHYKLFIAAALFFGCAPKPEKSDIKPGEPGFVSDTDTQEEPPDGDRAGSGYW